MNKLISKSTKLNLITKISNNTIYKVANHIYNNNSSLLIIILKIKYYKYLLIKNIINIY